MQHIIKKQVFDLSLNKKMDAFNIQHLVSEHYWREIIPVLQNAFDNISTNDEIITIDKLEINLGAVTIKDIEKGRWNDEVYKRISEQLDIEIRNVSSIKNTKKAKNLNAAEQWLFYMQHGYLSWNTIKINEQWHRQVLEVFATNAVFIDQLRVIIQTKSHALKRIINQHSESFLQSLIETLTAKRQNKLSKIIDEIVPVIKFFRRKNEEPVISQKKLKQLFWQQVLQYVSRKKNVSTLSLAVFLLKENISNPELIQQLPERFFTKNGITSASLKKLKKEIEGSKNAWQKKELQQENIIVNEEIPTTDEEGIFIQNAGIILLHPFLNIFFRNLGLIGSEKFIDEVTQEKAIYLLHYLATGNVKPEEHELVIAKILCGWSLQKPVTNTIGLTTQELSEANYLLTEVIERWDALKDTSSEGLREGFLQRNGKLLEKNEIWHLQVETNSIDVLLDFLPWSLQIIMLPWMNNILKTEWR
ncbi:MAG: contractile injection system tape measure protein [Agriterribacter sp.]